MAMVIRIILGIIVACLFAHKFPDTARDLAEQIKDIFHWS